MSEEKKNSELVDNIISQITENKNNTLTKEAKQTKLPQTPLIKEKHYYDVKVESMIPATLTYRVLAEDPQQAAELIRGMAPIGVKHKIVGKKDLKLLVYEAGCSIIKHLVNLSGR